MNQTNLPAHTGAVCDTQQTAEHYHSSLIDLSGHFEATVVKYASLNACCILLQVSAVVARGCIQACEVRINHQGLTNQHNKQLNRCRLTIRVFCWRSGPVRVHARSPLLLLTRCERVSMRRAPA